MPEDSQRDGLTESEPARKNKPKGTRLRQQKLAAWQPILTASTVIPTVFCVGIVFIPIGIALFIASSSVNEKLYKYAQDCDNRTQCSHTITLDSDYNGDVYFYYYLENFYQNHRRYVKSRNDLQYLGNLDEISECEPFTKVDGKVIVPCGAVANSMFNDTFQVTYNGVEVPVTEEGVVWEVDKDRKFANPPGNDLCTAINPSIYAKPPNWKDNICEKKNGLQNVDFIVWMRTAALPNFRKLWRKLDRSKPGFEGGLKKGDYVISITNNYPVKSFGGDKGFIISTSSWAGGKNNFLGIAYLVVGGVAVLLGIVFVAIHLRFGHSISELSNLQQHRE